MISETFLNPIVSHILTYGRRSLRRVINSLNLYAMATRLHFQCYVLFAMLLCGCSAGQPNSLAPSAKSQLRLVPLYQKQLAVFDRMDDEKDSSIINRLIVDSLYLPYRTLYDSCFITDRTTYIANQRMIYSSRRSEVRNAMAFIDQLQFDTILSYYQRAFPSFIGHPVTGTFYFAFFHRNQCSFCGCDKMTMQMDMLYPMNLSADHLRLLLPHELSHNVFEDTQSDTVLSETVLYKALDEGLANYAAQRMNGVSTSEAFFMTSDEYGWLTSHEDEIKEAVRPMLLSTMEEDWDPLGMQVPDSFMEGSPGNIGYYVGYRIIEDYLAFTDESDWRVVYTTPVDKLLEGSGWLDD